MTTASCHDPKVFDTYILSRFLIGKKTEAVKVVEQLAKDAPLSEAVLLAIESLTARESKELRRVVDQFHAWCEWHDVWEPKGWRYEAGPARDKIVLVSPAFQNYPKGIPKEPTNEVVAAAVKARSVRKLNGNVVPDRFNGWRSETMFGLQ